LSNKGTEGGKSIQYFIIHRVSRVTIGYILSRLQYYHWTSPLFSRNK